jgi:hypothetical protein
MRPVRINADFDAWYGAGYFRGLLQVFGTAAPHFVAPGFPRPFRHPREDQGVDLAFVTDKPELKVFVDFQDRPEVSAEALAWCDVYAKASADPAMLATPGEERFLPDRRYRLLTGVTPAQAAKILPLGHALVPRICGLLRAGFYATASYLAGRSIIAGMVSHFANWRGQWRRRLPESAYVPGETDPNYVFFSASLWPSVEAERCNMERGMFVEACRSLPGLNFEGGFAQRWALPPEWKARGFDKYALPVRPSHRQFIRNTQRSACAFNNPGFKRCHAWKLAEYLALGKAIISTPLERLLPAPLVHGEHVHFVEPSVDAIREAVRHLCRDSQYRRKLERNARAYYQEHLTPRRTIERMLAFGQERKSAAGRTTDKAPRPKGVSV